MNNKVVVGLVVGSALLVGFAVGRFTAADNGPVIKDSGDKVASTKKATTKRSGTYRPPHMDTVASAPTADVPPEGDNTNRFGRGRGNFNPSNYVAMVKERAATERSNLFASANLTPAQQQDFDELISAMNGSLKQRAEALVAAAKDGKVAGPEVMVRMMHDSSSSMIRAYDMMDRTMPADWREKAGASFSMMTFMDPSLRETMRGLRPPRGGGGPGGGGFGGGGGPPPQ